MKMKRYVSLLMAVALLICTGAIQVAVAASFTEPFFYDFEDCTATGSYGVLGGSWDDPSTAAQIDEEHGKSLVYTTKATHLNINGETTKNTIIGFSAYTNNSAKTSWRLVLKNAAVTDNIIERKYGNLNFIGGITQTDEDGWKNFTVGFDYETHRITVWMNGEKISDYQAGEDFTSTGYFQIYIPDVASDRENAYDDMYGYYPAEVTVTGSDSDGIVEPNITSYTVDMGQKVFGDNVGDSVKIYDSANSLISGTGSVGSTGYRDNVTVPLTEALVPGETYTAEISGVTDALGNAIEETLTFTAGGAYTVTVASSDDAKGSAAITNPAEGATFEPGTAVTVTATPSDGSLFAGWKAEGITLTAGQQAKSELTITMPDTNVTLTAIFVTEADATLTKPFFYDLEDCTATGNYGFLSAGSLWGTRVVSEVIDEEHGNSLRIVGTSGSNTTFLNMNTAINRNVVIGFSVYTSGTPTFRLASMGTTKVENIIELKAGSLNYRDGTTQADVAGWKDFAVGFDYISHTVTVWLNGEKVCSYQAEETFTSTTYFNIYVPYADATQILAFDNIFAYYPADETVTGSENEGVVGLDITSYTVNMGQKVFGDNLGGAVKIYDSANNLVSGTGSVGSTGYQNTVTVPISTSLIPGESYTAQISGVTDALGNAIEETISFCVESYYTVEAKSANDAMGRAEVITTGGPFLEGASVQVTATPNEGYKFTGWTAEGITLTADQQTQNPLTITVGSENVTLTAAFAALIDAVITPSAAIYDKYSESENHKAIEVTLDAGDYVLNALKNGEIALNAGTDYSVSGNVYTITTTYLETLTADATLTFEMSGGTNPTLAITVTDSTPATYTVTAASEDSTKGSAIVTTTGGPFTAGTSVMVQATPNEGYKFVGWTAEGISLTPQQQTENPLVLTMPFANVTLTAAFEELTKPATGTQKSIPFFYDFEDCTAAGDHGYASVGSQWGTTHFTGSIIAGADETFDKEYGRSLLLKVPASGSTPYINLTTNLKQNVIVGFSAYLDDKSNFALSSKGTPNVDSIIIVNSGTLKVKDGTTAQCADGWNHFCIGLDYTLHTVTVWLNGEKVSTYQAADTFVATTYFNLNVNRVSGASQLAFDDMYAYYPANIAVTGSDSNGVVEPDITTYTVNMGQKVFGDDLSGAVKIYDSANNLISETGSVSSTGYQDTITVPINVTLVPGAEYTVQISGVTDALGNAVSKTLTFSARDTAPKITLGCEETRTLPAGTVIDFTVNAQNLPADDILEVYLGGEKILDLAADTQKFDITLQKGENKVYVKSASTDVQTQEYVLEAFEYQEIKSYYNGDFETDESMSNLKGTGAMDGSIEVIDLEDEHGKVLKLEVEGSEMPYVLLPSVYGASGIVVLEGDFCFVTLKNRNIFPVKTKDGVWFTKIGEKGAEIQVFGESVAQVEAGEWYHMKVMYDTVSNQVSFFMDGRVYAFEADMGIDNKDGIDYCNQNSGTGSAGSPSILYMDNIREYLVGKPYTYNITLTDAAGSVRDRLPYENGKLNIEFSEAMTEETLAGITLSDENGNIIEPVSIAYDSSRNTYVLEVGTLLPNTAYTITIPATVKTAVGVEGNVGTATVITEKLPFCIDEVTTSEAAGNCTVDVLLQDTTGGGHEASVILCVYEGDRLYDVKVTAVNTANSLTVTEQLNTPTGQYSVEVYLIESLGTMKCIDMYCE